MKKGSTDMQNSIREDFMKTPSGIKALPDQFT